MKNVLNFKSKNCENVAPNFWIFEGKFQLKLGKLWFFRPWNTTRTCQRRSKPNLWSDFCGIWAASRTRRWRSRRRRGRRNCPWRIGSCRVPCPKRDTWWRCCAFSSQISSNSNQLCNSKRRLFHWHIRRRVTDPISVNNLFSLLFKAWVTISGLQTNLRSIQVCARRTECWRAAPRLWSAGPVSDLSRDKLFLWTKRRPKYSSSDGNCSSKQNRFLQRRNTIVVVNSIWLLWTQWRPVVLMSLNLNLKDNDNSLCVMCLS